MFKKIKELQSLVDESRKKSRKTRNKSKKFESRNRR